MKNNSKKPNVPLIVSGVKSEVFEGVIYKVKIIPPVCPGEWPSYVDIASAKKVLGAKVANEN